MERTVIVTGGFGFLGRKVSSRLREEGFRVIQMALPGEDVQGQDHIRGDITDPSSLDLPPTDIIVHCAGILESSHPTDQMMYKVNHEGTMNIYGKGLEAGMKKFVMISTVSAIGPQGTFESPMTEETEPRPDDTYGRSKLRAEQFLVKRGEEDVIDVIILRPTVLYGVGMNIHSSGMKTFTSLRKGIMPLVGEGRIIFNMLHVDNLVQAIFLSVTRGKGVMIFNVSEGPYTLKEVISTIEKEMGKKGHRRVPKAALYLAARAFQVMSPFLKGPPPVSMAKYRGLTSSIWHLNSSRIRRELGYEPVVSLQDGVRTTVREYGWGKREEQGGDE
ncbi:MAG: NAD-dependent epimerase/dehydratase family protein [Candidatus Thermoplasmatota archaeon]|nr:NAD-dependent epimerase/dehydratase family protein [Candidatus Thermoplasmatota archaeon]